MNPTRLNNQDKNWWHAPIKGPYAAVPWSAVVTRPCPQHGDWLDDPCDGSGQVPSWVFYCEDDEPLLDHLGYLLRVAVGLALREEEHIDLIEKSIVDDVLRLLRGEAPWSTHGRP